MSGRKRIVGVLAALSIVLVWGSGSASATLTITVATPGGSAITASVTGLLRTASIGAIRCNWTLNGSITAATYAVPLGAGEVSIGSITSGTITGCSPAISVMLTGLPWPINVGSDVLVGSGLYRIRKVFDG